MACSSAPLRQPERATIAMPRIAVLMTCHNRKELTLRCLRSLQEQPLFEQNHLFLVDDGCTDGTGDAVRALLPDAKVVQGSGDLFWNGGMNLAWDTARRAGVDFEHYLWLNDDVILAAGAIERLVADADAVAGENGVIVAGTTVEIGTDVPNYGGQSAANARRPLRLRLVPPSGAPQPVQTISGNVVLVSAAAARRLGGLSPLFKHIFGDLDYGLRAQAAGVPVFAASSVAGECETNPIAGSALDKSLGRWRRLTLAMRAERTIHARDWRAFVRRHSGLGPFSFLYSASPYVRILLGK